MFHAVERRELAVGRAAAHHDLAAGDLRRVEGVERMAHLVEHEVRDVHDIVDRALADGHQALLHPVGRRTDFHILEGDADITGGQIGRLDHNGDGFPCPGLEPAHVGKGPFDRDVVLYAIGIQVARHADVAGTVHAVRRQTDLEERVFLQMELLPGRRTHDGRRIEHHDAGVVAADAQFIFGADHAATLDAADLRALDLELGTVVGRKVRPDGRHEDLLALCHVGRTADHLQQFRCTGIEFSHMQMVGVGMRHTFDHFRHDDAGQSAGNLLHGLHVLHFQSGRGQDRPHLVRRQVEFQIILQPVE